MLSAANHILTSRSNTFKLPRFAHISFNLGGYRTIGLCSASYNVAASNSFVDGAIWKTSDDTIERGSQRSFRQSAGMDPYVIVLKQSPQGLLFLEEEDRENAELIIHCFKAALTGRNGDAIPHRHCELESKHDMM